MKKVLLVRIGAYGDMLHVTPVAKKLKEEGYYVVLNTGKRGKEVFENNPNVDEIILHDEKMPIENLSKHWDELKDRVKPDRFINFTESIECNVALHPMNPMYIYPKNDREKICNKNYYEVTYDWAKVDGCQMLPEVYLTKEEEEQAKGYLDKEKYNIVWALSGSGKQKVYPWAEYVMGELLKNFNDIHIITVGDLRCQLLETLIDKDIKHLAGEVPFRISIALTKFADLVIAPDTGILHAAGCFETPKIGLLGHTTIENITKHFKNDYSLEAICNCAPCFRLIYDHDVQCPIDFVTHASWCMAVGIPPERVYERINYVREKHSKRR